MIIPHNFYPVPGKNVSKLSKNDPCTAQFCQFAGREENRDYVKALKIKTKEKKKAGSYTWHDFSISIKRNKKILECTCIFSAGHLQNKKNAKITPVLITALRESRKIGWVLLARQPIFPTFT